KHGHYCGVRPRLWQRLQSTGKPKALKALKALVVSPLRAGDACPCLSSPYAVQLLKAFKALKALIISRDPRLHSVSSNSVPCPSPLRPGSFLPFVFPSISSQLTSSIGGGTTRTKLARLTASKPLPPRVVGSYLLRPNSICRPPEVS